MGGICAVTPRSDPTVVCFPGTRVTSSSRGVNGASKSAASLPFMSFSLLLDLGGDHGLCPVQVRVRQAR